MEDIEREGRRMEKGKFRQGSSESQGYSGAIEGEGMGCRHLEEFRDSKIS